MSEPASLPTVPVSVRIVEAETVFAALGDPSRRRILMALSDGRFHLGRALGSAIGRRFDNTRKHLDGLVKAGLVVAENDPSDPRRQHYRLASSVKVAETPEGKTMDFGHCMVRL